MKPSHVLRAAEKAQGPQSPEEAVARYFAALKAGDWEAVWATLAEPWSSYMRQEAALAGELKSRHAKLTATLDRKFGKEPDSTWP